MRRARLILLACVALSATLAGQLIYNPLAFQFEHELVGGWDVTDHYQFGIMEDQGADTLLTFLWTVDVPKSDVIALPPAEGATVGTFRVPMTGLPALPVGRSYRAVVYAVDAEQRASFPSNITPESFRFNACALEGSAGVQLPSLAIPTWPALRAGQGVILDLHVTAPHPVQFLMIDLVGDNAPAWYYVASVPVGRPSVARVGFGPVGRAGRYEVFARLIDSGGCEATLPFGTFVTVS